MNYNSTITNNSRYFFNAPHIIGPVITFIVGVFLSISIFSLVRGWEESQLQSTFEQSARNRLASIQIEITRHQELVHSIASLYSSSQHVSRKEFRSFVAESLSRYPSIQSLGWNPVIKRNEQNSYIEQAHKDGFRDFQITGFDDNGQVEKSRYPDEAVVVYYIEPYAGNEKAMGLNIASNPSRLKAIQRARDTGKAVITERIKLVQEQDESFGYLLLKAVYKKEVTLDTVAERRKHFVGLSTGAFRFENLILSSVQNLPPVGMDVLITDQSAQIDKQFLHFHSSRTRSEVILPTPKNLKEAKKGLHWQTSVDVLGRQWSFLFTPAPAFFALHRSWQAWTILVAGLSFTFLLTFYLFTKARHIIRTLRSNLELHHEVTERKMNESELKKQIDFIDTVLDAASNIIAVIDLEGKVVRFNRAAEELTGYSLDETIGRPVWELFIPDDQKNGVITVFNNLLNGETEIASQYQNEWLTKNGGRCLLQWHNSVLHDENGKISHIVAMGYDMTEKKKIEVEHERLQRELQQSHKMESLGQLTGGIAHDFNNLLGVINGYADLIFVQYKNVGDDKLVKYSRHIKEAGDRAAKLVAQMLAFSHGTQIDDTPVKLELLLKQDIELLRATLPSSIEITSEIEPGLPSVVMNPIHLYQILMNLAVNARDAMLEVGQLNIKLGWARNLNTVSQVSYKAVTGDWIELSVSDTGSGIDTETVKKIFNPFFTTKEVGKGTGMGLSVIYGIMESHDGHILLESEVGKGSTFHLLFPPVYDEGERVTLSNQGLSEIPRGDSSEILLVDDEASLVTLMCEFVVNHGYKAHFVTDSLEALALFQREPNRFSMLITDQTMPKMTGLELIEKLRIIRPELPIILCTGNAGRINSSELEAMDIVLLEKPIHSQQLLSKIAELFPARN